MDPSRFQYPGDWKIFRGEPVSPGSGMPKPVASLNNTGPGAPTTSCSRGSGFAPTMAARESCEKFDVRAPLRTLNGSPDMALKIPLTLHPPMRWFQNPDADAPIDFPLPKGSS